MYSRLFLSTCSFRFPLHVLVSTPPSQSTLFLLLHAELVISYLFNPLPAELLWIGPFTVKRRLLFKKGYSEYLWSIKKKNGNEFCVVHNNLAFCGNEYFIACLDDGYEILLFVCLFGNLIFIVDRDALCRFPSVWFVVKPL